MKQTHNTTKLNITLLCSDAEHPVMPYLRYWQAKHHKQHNVNIIHQAAEAAGGDILFLAACMEAIQKPVHSRYKHVLKLDETLSLSRLLDGGNTVSLSLTDVLTNNIVHRVDCHFKGHELYNEINMNLFEAELKLMDFAVENFSQITPQKQDESKATYYPRRTPADSELDPTQPLASQFDQLRVADPHRFPAFFRLRGHTYYLYIKKGQADTP